MSEEEHTMSRLEDVQKLQKLFNSIDIETMYAMSQSKKLQNALSSDDFFTNMAASLLFSETSKSPDPLFPHPPTPSAPASAPTDSAQAELMLNQLSQAEKSEIQKTLSTYDNTLKITLDAIRNGDLNESKMLQPIFQDLPSDSEMNQFLKNIESNKIKKVKVNNDISISLESAEVDKIQKQALENSSLAPKSAKTADEYIEQMIKIINQNKKFDNFLEEVSKIENLSNNEGHMQEHEINQISDNDSSKQTKESTITNEDDNIKSQINEQIVNALQSFKLDGEVEEDIVHEIAKSIEKNKYLFPQGTDRNIQDSNKIKQLSRDYFGDQLKQFQAGSLQELDSVNQGGAIPGQDHDFIQQPQGQSHIEQNQMTHPPARSSSRRIELEICGESTVEQRQKLQRECLEKLRVQDLHPGEESNKKNKKKKNKKKKKTNKGFDPNLINHIGVNNPENDSWLCEICEYKIVYGEVPTFLTEWLQKKASNSDKMETYQRYLFEQQKERKRRQKMDNSSHNASQDRPDDK